jgi:hypothetical protein
VVKDVEVIEETPLPRLDILDHLDILDTLCCNSSTSGTKKLR